MKKYLIVLFCLVLFLGCGEEKSENINLEPNLNTKSGEITIKSGENSNLQNLQNAYTSYDMDGVKRVKFGVENADLNETAKQTATAIGGLAFVRSPLQSINKALIRGKLSKNFIQKCSACHDDYANGIIGPSLLDKTNEQIFEMISAYKSKTKANVLMADLVKAMSENEIKALADEISEFNKQFREKK